MWRTLVSEAHTLHTAIVQQMSSWHEQPAGALGPCLLKQPKSRCPACI